MTDRARALPLRAGAAPASDRNRSGKASERADRPPTRRKVRRSKRTSNIGSALRQWLNAKFFEFNSAQNKSRNTSSLGSPAASRSLTALRSSPVGGRDTVDRNIS